MTDASPFLSRFVQPRPAWVLAGIRVLVFAILLVSVVWEDLASTACLPAEMRQSMGVMQWTEDVPLLGQLQDDYRLLAGFQWVTVGLLVCALLGLGTRATVPAASLAYLIHGGILRQYDHFYHTGLAPLHLALALSLMPCGDALSLDRLRAVRRGAVRRRPDEVYGWCQFICWLIVVSSYVAAGANKLRGGGLDWWNADNIRRIMFSDALSSMQFDFGWSLYFKDAPSFVFVAIGFGAVALELSAAAMLFSRRARRVIPWLLVGMHFGILLMQNILFFDLMVLQLIFLDWPRLVGALRRRWSSLTQRLAAWRRFALIAAAGRRVVQRASRASERLGISFGEPAGGDSVSMLEWAAGDRAARTGASVAIVLASVLAVVWLFAIEFYPLTSWQMYCVRRVSGEAVYFRAVAHYEDGRVAPARFDHWVPALSDGRHRRVVREAFGADRAAARRFLDVCLARARRAGGSERVRCIELQRWRWRFHEQPHGELEAWIRYPERSSRKATAPSSAAGYRKNVRL